MSACQNEAWTRSSILGDAIQIVNQKHANGKQRFNFRMIVLLNATYKIMILNSIDAGINVVEN